MPYQVVIVAQLWLLSNTSSSFTLLPKNATGYSHIHRHLLHYSSKYAFGFEQALFKRVWVFLDTILTYLDKQDTSVSSE